jgi:O-antigen ligase
MYSKKYLQFMNDLTQALGVLMVFVLIFPTALVNVVLFLMVLVYTIGGRYREKWRHARNNPVGRISMLFFVWFALAMSYSSSDLSTSLGVLNQYRELLLIPLVISIFNDGRWRQRAYFAFFVAILVAVMVSFGMRFGWLPTGSLGEEWVPFKSRISYGFFLALAVYLMSHQSLRCKILWRRWFWGMATCLAAFNLTYMVSGRTGHVVLLALILLFAYQFRANLKEHVFAYMAVFAILLTTVIMTSPAIQSRDGDIELAASEPEHSSIGQRLVMWKTAVRIIADHPIMGAGTGSFAREYEKRSTGYPATTTANPHSEYLLIASQLGLPGLCGFLFVFLRQWKMATILSPPYGYAAQGLVLAMAVGCMFNSFLYDFGEGHFYSVYAGLLFSELVPVKTRVETNGQE